MEKMPILILLLYSIPESIILISLCSAIYGYKVQENLYRVVLLGISLALVTYIVRALPIQFGLNMAIQIPVFIFLTWKYLRVPLLRAFYLIMTASIIIFLAEMISYPLVSAITGLTTQEIVHNTYLRILTGWVHLSLMGAITIVLLKKNISLIQPSGLLRPRNTGEKITLLIIGLVLIQATLSGALNLTIFIKNTTDWPSMNNLIFTATISLLLFTIPIVSIFFLKRLLELSEKESIIETQEAFIDNINKLFVTIRAQRHDFIHHVQVIYSMLNTDQSQEAIKYMDNLLEEIQNLSNVIKVKDPVLSALFNAKTAIAERHNINLEIRIETPLDGLSLKPFEIVKILGNLIDNALEAVAQQPAEYRRVKVSLKKFAFVFVFDVCNPRPVIQADDMAKVFSSGFSTKDNHSGLGLAVVKDLVERNGGEISLRSSEEDGTTFSVIIPVK